MFKDLTIAEALQRIAEPDDWAEYQTLKKEGYEAEVFIISNYDPSGEKIVRGERFWALFERFTSALTAKLIEGLWTARGFNPAYGPTPQAIHADLWRVLKIITQDQDVVGGGFTFSHVLVSENIPTAMPVSHVGKTSLKHRVTRWIEEACRSRAEAVTKSALLSDVREQFSDDEISNNLFNEAWKAADKPVGSVHSGRPKAKG